MVSRARRSCSSLGTFLILMPRQILPQTVFQGRRPKSCRIIPTSREGALISRPSMRTLPAVGLDRPASMYRRVLFPQPEGPIMVRERPLPTENDMSSIILISGANTLVSPSAVSIRSPIQFRRHHVIVGELLR